MPGTPCPNTQHVKAHLLSMRLGYYTETPAVWRGKASRVAVQLSLDLSNLIPNMSRPRDPFRIFLVFIQFSHQIKVTVHAGWKGLNARLGLGRDSSRPQVNLGKRYSPLHIIEGDMQGPQDTQQPGFAMIRKLRFDVSPDLIAASTFATDGRQHMLH